MIRFVFCILINILWAPLIIYVMHYKSVRPMEYSIEERYESACFVVRLLKLTGGVRTKAYGLENLPTEGGYMMYPNHQGKYDALGIVNTHKKPCSLVMDKNKSNTILVKQFVDLLEGKRLDKQDRRQGFKIIQEITEEVKNGKKFILFPEGGYDNSKKNNLDEFKSGCFKIALKSKTPIVPVTLVNSYKVFNSLNFLPVKTEVHYLTPIYYEEYKELKTSEIADLVKQRIQEKLNELSEKNTKQILLEA